MLTLYGVSITVENARPLVRADARSLNERLINQR